MYLIDGRCEEEINKYIEESHTFDEFVEKVNFFVDLGGKINNNETLPKEVNLGMFQLHCEDLISNLARKTTVLRELVLKKMSQGIVFLKLPLLIYLFFLNIFPLYPKITKMITKDYVRNMKIFQIQPCPVHPTLKN